MIGCLTCSANPFSWFLPDSAADEAASPRSAPRFARAVRAVDLADLPAQDAYQPRTPEQVEELVQEWLQYVHPRASDFFQTRQVLTDVLEQIASNVDRRCDPVRGDDEESDECCCWYGQVSQAGRNRHPAVLMTKPGEQQASVTYVTRLLVFIFSSDETFRELMRLPKAPFKTTCGNPCCVQLSHVAFEVVSMARNRSNST